MNISFIVFLFVGFLVGFWFLGLGVYAYHVLAFGRKEDATKRSLSVLVFLAFLIFIIATFYFSAFDWRSL